jgi:hypothetical protein
VILSHGYSEHLGLYQELGSLLAAEGFLAFGHDHGNVLLPFCARRSQSPADNQGNFIAVDWVITKSGNTTRFSIPRTNEESFATCNFVNLATCSQDNYLQVDGNEEPN